MQPTHIIERAFDLARESASLRELKAALKEEGYGAGSIDAHLSGRQIKAQLNERLLPSDKKRRVR
jgi:hypothetical protein